jgi:hypothetical protein
MAGLVPAIHAFLTTHRKRDVDGRDKHGHDDVEGRVRHAPFPHFAT